MFSRQARKSTFFLSLSLHPTPSLVHVCTCNLIEVVGGGPVSGGVGRVGGSGDRSKGGEGGGLSSLSTRLRQAFQRGTEINSIGGHAPFTGVCYVPDYKNCGGVDICTLCLGSGAPLLPASHTPPLVDSPSQPASQHAWLPSEGEEREKEGLFGEERGR